MRRTITTLMFLAMSGLAFAAHAADNGNANWQYYAAGASSYRISDDDDGQSHVANAGGQAQLTGQEKNALYVADNSAGNGVAQACPVLRRSLPAPGFERPAQLVLVEAHPSAFSTTAGRSATSAR